MWWTRTRKFNLHAIKSFTTESSSKWTTLDLVSQAERDKITMQARISATQLPTAGEQLFRLSSSDSEKFDRILKGGVSSSNRRASAISSSGGVKTESFRKSLNPNSDLPSKIVRGFLEINPSICSGCGSSFQSKRVDAPGYLPPDKFRKHQEVASDIRKQQEAIRVLEMAGIDYGSFAAEKMLRLSGYSEDVIAQV